MTLSFNSHLHLLLRILLQYGTFIQYFIPLAVLDDQADIEWYAVDISLLLPFRAGSAYIQFPLTLLQRQYAIYKHDAGPQMQ